MWVCLYVYMYACMFLCVWACVYVFVCVCLGARVLCALVYACCVYARPCVCIVCMHNSMCLCVYGLYNTVWGSHNVRYIYINYVNCNPLSLRPAKASKMVTYIFISSYSNFHLHKNVSTATLLTMYVIPLEIVQTIPWSIQRTLRMEVSVHLSPLLH